MRSQCRRNCAAAARTRSICTCSILPARRKRLSRRQPARASAATWSILSGQQGSVYLARLKPGGVGEPHWHPSAWELNFVISGKVRWSLVGPNGTHDTFDGGAQAVQTAGNQPTGVRRDWHWPMQTHLGSVKSCRFGKRITSAN